MQSSLRLIVAGTALVGAGLTGALIARTPVERTQQDARRTPETGARCRCAEQPMGDYYAAATDVVIAQLLDVSPATDTHRLRFRLLDAPFRSSASLTRFTDDTVVFRTAATTAECGVVGEIGATYVVFGDAKAPDGGDRTPTPAPPLVSSCTGTRVFRTADSDSLHDFVDVPGAFVHSQLSALSGMDVLRELATTTPDDLDTLGRSMDATTNTPRDGVLIGLLEIPDVATSALTIHAEPSTSSAILTTVRELTALQIREVSYEQPAAVVQARARDWYRVLLRDGRAGWMLPTSTAMWHPIETLVVNRLGYLTAHWSGLVWPSPGAGNPVRVPRARPDANGSVRGQYPAEVLETTRVGGTLWLRVRVLATDPCEGGDGRATAGGWVPAYGAGGRPTAWFHSRGC